MTACAAGFSYSNPDPILVSFVEAMRALLQRPRSPAEFRRGLLAAAARLSTPRLSLPEDCRCINDLGYGRNLLYRETDSRFTVVAMVWPAGATTPIHDHGTWCCESVIAGRVEITPYAVEAEGQLQPRPKLVQGAGEADCLVPPDDWHAVANPFAEPALTIHTYGRDINCCNVWNPAARAVESLQLSYANLI